MMQPAMGISASRATSSARCTPPEAAAELAGDAGRGENGPHARQVVRPAVAGPVEIDQVQALGPLVDEAAGDGGRVGVVDGFALVVALHKPHATAAAQIDCGPD